MAIYHFSRNIGKRAEGKNAVFMVAYIRGESKECIRIGQTENFENRHDVASKGIVLPNDAPEWTQSAQGKALSDLLWNHLEFAEKHPRAQLYFHDHLALPRELTIEQCQSLVQDYINHEVAQEGIFCDFAIHYEQHNPHVHIITPMRQLTDYGFSNKVQFKSGELSKIVKNQRAKWADYTNKHLAKANVYNRVDHRSYQDRGIDLIPTKKLGKATHINGEHHARKVTENAIIRTQNLAKIANNPGIIADKIAQENAVGLMSQSQIQDEVQRHYVRPDIAAHITDASDEQSQSAMVESVLETLEKQHGIFDDKQIKKALFEHDADGKDYQNLVHQITQHDSLIPIGLGVDGRETYISKTHFYQEMALRKAINRIDQTHSKPVKNRHIQKAIDQYTLNDSQAQSLQHILSNRGVSVTVGYAGTGKTHMMKAAKDVWQQNGYQVIGTALSGAASKGLSDETGMTSYTIASLKQQLEKGQLTLDKNTVLVIDEFGMNDLNDTLTLVNYAQQSGAKIAAIGDQEQTQPIGTGAPMRSVIDEVGCSSLTTIMRQKTSWQQQATTLMETQQTAQGMALYQQHGHVHQGEQVEDTIDRLVDDWYQSDVALTDKTMIAFTNQDVDRINQTARTKLTENGLLNDSVAYQNSQGHSIPIAPGERLLFTRNNHHMGVQNGSLGTVVAIDQATSNITVELDNQQTIEFNPHHYGHFKHGYGITVHKSQGATTDQSFVYFGSRAWDRHSTLVALSRHKTNLEIYFDHQTHEHFESLTQMAARNGLKDHVYDYPFRFATNRGEDAHAMIDKTAKHLGRNTQWPWSFVRHYQEAQTHIHQEYQAHADLSASRQSAKMVAEYADRQAEIAQLVQSIEATQDQKQLTSLWNDLYDKQRDNAALAYRIEQSDTDLTAAKEANRINPTSFAKSLQFYQAQSTVAQLFDAYRYDQPVNQNLAADLVNDYRNHHRHVMAYCRQHQISDQQRHRFTHEMRYHASRAQYQQAFNELGLTYRNVIKSAYDYVHTNYAISKHMEQLKQSHDSEHSDKTQQALNDLQRQRDKLANTIDGHDKIMNHFALDADKLAQHRDRHQTRQMAVDQVKAFAHAETDLKRQIIAHQIKQQPFTLYQSAVETILPEGWKSINIANWHYQRSVKVAQSSRTHQASVGLTKRYMHHAQQANAQWKQFYYLKEKGSERQYTALAMAQRDSYRRDQLAKRLIDRADQTGGAITLARLDTKKLNQQAGNLQQFNHYAQQPAYLVRLKAASTINQNMRAYGNYVQTLGLYRQVKQDASTYQRRQTIKGHSPATHTFKQYHDLTGMAAHYWRKSQQAQAYRHETNQARYAQLSQAYHRQAAPLAYRIYHGFEQYRGIIQAHIGQGKAYERFMNHLERKAEHYRRREADLAKSPQQSHRGYHQEQQTSSRWDADLIHQALTSDIETTYRHIFGEPKSQNQSEIRWSGGLVVSLRGQGKGMWYDFVAQEGGSPVQAIMRDHGLSYRDALAEGAHIAGLSQEQATTEAFDSSAQEQRQAEAQKQAEQEKQQKIDACRSLWAQSQPLQGTIGQQYLKQHRGIEDTSQFAMRFVPRGVNYQDADGSIKHNKVPMLVVPGYDAQQQLVSLQRVYLDSNTANKATFMDNPKMSMGAITGSAGLIQKGDNGRAYVVEGPETGASIANADPKATVYASFGIFNVGNIDQTLKQHQQVYIAADNDGVGSNAEQLTHQAQQKLKAKKVNATIITPQALEQQDKTDWNDIHQAKGLEAVQAQLPVSQEKTLAPSVDPTITNQSLFESKIHLDLTSLKQPADPVAGYDQLMAMMIKKQEQTMAAQQANQNKQASTEQQASAKQEMKDNQTSKKHPSVERLYITDNYNNAKALRKVDKKAKVEVSMTLNSKAINNAIEKSNPKQIVFAISGGVGKEMGVYDNLYHAFSHLKEKGVQASVVKSKLINWEKSLEAEGKGQLKKQLGVKFRGYQPLAPTQSLEKSYHQEFKEKMGTTKLHLSEAFKEKLEQFQQQAEIVDQPNRVIDRKEHQKLSKLSDELVRSYQNELDKVENLKKRLDQTRSDFKKRSVGERTFDMLVGSHMPNTARLIKAATRAVMNYQNDRKFEKIKERREKFNSQSKSKSKGGGISR